MTLWSFLRQQSAFLGFGFLCFALSNFGQTFFIALYNEEIRDSFNLSQSAFGSIYGAVTLLSAVVFFYSGKLIDAWPLRSFVGVTVVGLVVASITMALSYHVWTLVVALFLLRHFGQGLSTHIGMTSVSRSYSHHRGVAVSISQLGLPFGESIMPLIAISLMLWVGWRETWLVFAAIILFAALPVVLWLTRFEPISMESTAGQVQAGRGAVLRDPRFYGVMPLYIAPAFLLTGMFFSHTALIASRGWSLQVLAQAFSLYAGCKIISSLISGRIVDAVTARRFQPFAAIPLMLAFGVLALPDIFTSETSLYIYLALCGINLGMAAPISGGLWPEMYGTAHLGAIRSMTGPVIILSTSIAPVLFGFVLEHGISFSALAQAAIVYMMLAMILAFWAGYYRPTALVKE
jgi:MFS family permease